MGLKEFLFGKQLAQIQAAQYPRSTQKWIPIVDIRDGIVLTKDGRYVKVLEVLPVNFELKSPIERQNIIYYYAAYLKIAPDNLQIKVITQKADIEGYVTRLWDFYAREPVESCREMIEDNINEVTYLAANEAVTRRFFLSANGEIRIVVAPYALHKSKKGGVRGEGVTDPSPRDAPRILVSPLDSGATTVPDILAPASIDLTNRDYVVVDGVYHAYLYIAGYGYTSAVTSGWLSPLAEIGEGINLSFITRRQQKDKVLPKIAQTTMVNRSRMRDVGDTRQDYEELDSAINSGLWMKDEMNRNGEDFYYMHTLIEVTADDADTLEQRVAMVETRCTSMNMVAKRCDYKHEQGFLSSLPLLSLDPDIERKSRRNALTTGVAARCASFLAPDQK